MNEPDPPRPVGPAVRRVPPGDDRARLTCESCGFVLYENPKVVVGSVVAAPDRRLLLCRRAIEPRRGFWTLPAGYLELGETAEEGAIREAWEEARAAIALEGVLAVYSVARIHQVQIIYRARLLEPDVAPGPESAEVALFAWDSIPWDEIAFPTVRWALGHWHEVADLEHWPARGNPPESSRGVQPPRRPGG